MQLYIPSNAKKECIITLKFLLPLSALVARAEDDEDIDIKSSQMLGGTCYLNDSFLTDRYIIRSFRINEIKYIANVNTFNLFSSKNPTVNLNEDFSIFAAVVETEYMIGPVSEDYLELINVVYKDYSLTL